MATWQENCEKWLKKGDAHTRAELEALSGNDAELAERFSSPLSFGTGGMRGIIGAGTARMNKYTVRRAARGVASFLTGQGGAACKAGVVIAYDTRNQSLEFALECARVLSAALVRVFIFAEPRPVPIISFAIPYLGASAGIMITASHNPKEYNGFKLYGGDGAQMNPENTAAVVTFIEATDYFQIPVSPLELRGAAQKDSIGRDKSWLNDYTYIISESVDKPYYDTVEKLCLSPNEVKSEKDGLKIIYTPLHGAGNVPVSTVLRHLGIPFEVVPEQAAPDPNFSTLAVAPNPENPEALTMAMAYANVAGGDIVIATDPDSDRMGAAIKMPNNEFYTLSGNQIGALLMNYILSRRAQQKNLPQNAAVIKTVVTTDLASRIAENYGVHVEEVLTGFKYIGEKITRWQKSKEHSYIFGFEESLGYLAGTYCRDKDAVSASMLFAEMVCFYHAQGLSLFMVLEGLYRRYGYYADKAASIEFKGIYAMRDMTEMIEELRRKGVTELGGKSVAYTLDILTSKKTFADGRVEKVNLPPADVLKFVFEGGSWAAVRPSGTEPKLKAYISCVEKTRPAAFAQAEAVLADLKKHLAL